MYKVTFKRGLIHLARLFISPLSLSILLVSLLLPIYLSAYRLPELAALSIKTGIVILVSGLYIQLSGVYDIINLIQSKIKK